MKTCKKTCTDIQSECLGNGLKDQLEGAMGLGKLVDGFLGESASVIKVWVKKLTTCDGESISSSETDCLSASYDAPLCNPDVSSEEPVTDAPTTKRPGAMCCKAMTASCLSCVAGQTEEEYCKSNPTVHGCAAFSATTEAPENDSTESPTTKPPTRPHEPVVKEGNLFCPRIAHMPEVRRL